MSSTETQFDNQDGRTVSLGLTHQNFMRNAAQSTNLPRELQLGLLDLLHELGSYPRRAHVRALAQVLDAISDELVRACTPPTDETGPTLPSEKDWLSDTSAETVDARAGGTGVGTLFPYDPEDFAQRITRAVLGAITDNLGILNAVRRCVGAEVKDGERQAAYNQDVKDGLSRAYSRPGDGNMGG